VATVKRNPGDRIARLASIKHSLDMLPAIAAWIRGVCRSTAVVLDKAIAHGLAAADVQSPVVEPVDAEIRNRVVPARTTRQLSASEDSDGPEVLGTSTGNRVGHGTAVRESQAEALTLVNAEIALDVLDHGVHKVHILAAAVAPAVVETLWGYENRTLCGLALQTVVRPELPVRAAAGNVVHGAAHPVEGKDEFVVLVAVIAGWDAHLELSVLAVHADGSDAGVEGGFAAS